MKSINQNWFEIWSKKGSSSAIKNLKFQDLLRLNGYDSGADAIDVDDWERWIKSLFDEIPDLKNVDDWLDAGCGCGCFLFSLPKNIQKYGFDYSSSLIDLGKKFASDQKIACDLSVEDLRNDKLEVIEKDVISVVSCLQYISHKEAQDFMQKVFNSAKVGVLIAETPDIEFISKSEGYRSAVLNYQVSEELTHTYYDKNAFDEIAFRKSFVSIELKSKLGHQSKYRWSRYFKKY